MVLLCCGQVLRRPGVAGPNGPDGVVILRLCPGKWKGNGSLGCMLHEPPFPAVLAEAKKKATAKNVK